jgi:hypothetical protein
MRLLTTGRVMAPALFLVTGLLVATAGGVAGQPGKDKEKLKDKGPKGGPERKAGKDLRKAFDHITDLAQTPAGKDGGKLLDHARGFYREAIRSYRDDHRKAGELAAAANDAARGLDHLRRASYRPVAGLPEPPDGPGGPPLPPAGPKDDGPKGKAPPPPPKDGPKGKGPPPIPAAGPGEPGPWAEALDALTRAHDRITDAGGSPAKGPARDFLDAAKAAYTRGRTAYEAGEFRRAAELARAADAFAHVPDHLDRAGWDGPVAPPVAPEPKAKRPGVPPPPAAIRD